MKLRSISRFADPDVLFAVRAAEHRAAAVRAQGVIDERRFVQRPSDASRSLMTARPPADL